MLRGEAFAWNHPDQADLFVVALPMAGLLVLGFLAGLIRGPGWPLHAEGESDAGERHIGPSTTTA